MKGMSTVPFLNVVTAPVVEVLGFAPVATVPAYVTQEPGVVGVEAGADCTVMVSPLNPTEVY
jgi:ABC-type anion transport system duplicated permease subunit